MVELRKRPRSGVLLISLVKQIKTLPPARGVQYLDGMDDLDKAINLNLNFDEAKVYVVRGIARFELGKRDDAFTDFDRAIHIKPDYPNAHAIRGESKAKSNDIPGAKVDFQNALGLAKEQGEKELIEAIEKSLQELNEVE